MVPEMAVVHLDWVKWARVSEILICFKDFECRFVPCSCRLDANTMFQVRKWERFQFMIGYEHQQVLSYLLISVCNRIKLYIFLLGPIISLNFQFPTSDSRLCVRVCMGWGAAQDHP